jgi:hypothetical protein
MRYVILRDDDTNAFTPVECLERLYRPFLERGLPVNLAVIPAVSTAARKADGSPEGFLFGKNGTEALTKPIGSNSALVRYLLDNPGYRIAQHGLHHSYLEFDSASAAAIGCRLELGTRLLTEAGFPQPRTFIAPYDRFSPASLREVARRFRVISTGWFELRRLPRAWWPRYSLKKLAGARHWRIGHTLLLSHPGCLLSCERDYPGMFDNIVKHLDRPGLTVLVTHWWEYFRGDTAFVSVLHRLAEYLRSATDTTVIAFDDLPQSRLPLG